MDYYTEAGRALSLFLSGKSSLKGSIYDTASEKNLRRVYALVMEASKSRVAVEAAIESSGLGAAARSIGADMGLVIILCHELLFGQKQIKGGGSLKRLIVEHEDKLKESVKSSQIVPAGSSLTSASSTSSSPVVGQTSHLAPRFVRVNTLRISTADAISSLCDASISPTGVGLTISDIVVNKHIPYVLSLPSNAHAVIQLHNHPLVTSGSLILQDLASAFPAHALLAESGLPQSTFDVIDACAAPGNKTSQLVALLRGKNKAVTKKRKREAALGGKEEGTQAPLLSTPGTVFAFDRSRQRLDLLQKRVTEAGASAYVVAECTDFLTVRHDAASFKNVKMVLLDPSCSGSGMKAHGSSTLSQDADKEANLKRLSPPLPPTSELGRIKALADFQVRALIHALSFPQVSRVAYSTCSLYAAEDECVVASALQQHNSSAFVKSDPKQKARLVSCLPTWTRRGFHGDLAGNLSEEQASCLVRAFPEEEGTTGFFVALFEKDNS